MVSCGDSFTIAISSINKGNKSGGEAYGWGSGVKGNLGIG